MKTNETNTFAILLDAQNRWVVIASREKHRTHDTLAEAQAFAMTLDPVADRFEAPVWNEELDAEA